jgi:hypothetical protein
MAKQKMMNMTAYSNGYTPPKGNAGSAAFGEYSHKHNPMQVPKKGSSITGIREFGSNSDHGKVQSLKEAEMKKEALRGYGC